MTSCDPGQSPQGWTGKPALTARGGEKTRAGRGPRGGTPPARAHSSCLVLGMDDRWDLAHWLATPNTQAAASGSFEPSVVSTNYGLMIRFRWFFAGPRSPAPKAPAALGQRARRRGRMVARPRKTPGFMSNSRRDGVGPRSWAISEGAGGGPKTVPTPRWKNANSISARARWTGGPR